LPPVFGAVAFLLPMVAFLLGGAAFGSVAFLRGVVAFVGGGQASSGWRLLTTTCCLVAAPRPLLRHIAARLGAGHEMILFVVDEGGSVMVCLLHSTMREEGEEVLRSQHV
jgi:hypothetical protein